MPITSEQVKALIDALKECGFDPKPYSGRGMYGKECVSVRDVSVWDIAKCLFQEEYDATFLKLPAPTEDAMGLGNVLYWPRYEWPKDRG